MPKLSNTIGQFWNNVSGQTAAMDKQYKQNVNIAKNQYQWAVEDMEKAGLNPAMMFGGGAGHTATTQTGIGPGSGSNIAAAINATANLARAFNFDNDSKNNANAKTIINILKNF